MTGKQFYDMVCRFPQEILPGGLRIELAQVCWKPDLGWIGEFWFSAPEALLPHLYMKLHLPGGEVLRLQNDAPGRYLAPEGQNRPEPGQKLMEYLDLCARHMEEECPDEATQNEVGIALPFHFHNSEEMLLWWLNRPDRVSAPPPGETPPPRWLLEYWTAERIMAWERPRFESHERSDEEFALLEFGNKCMARTCVPDQLIAGLPRFSYNSEQGWMVEYLYFYRNEFDYSISPYDPQYRLKLSWPSGALIEAENLTGILQFKRRWGFLLLGEEETHYLKQCRLLLEEDPPAQTQVDELQGLWLINTSASFDWLLKHKRVTEEMQRGVLTPRWPRYRELLYRIWSLELLKGVRLGTPEVSEHCVRELTAAKPFLLAWSNKEL